MPTSRSVSRTERDAAKEQTEPKYFTIDELAARWRISRSMVRKVIHEGLPGGEDRVRLRVVRIGRAVRVPAAAAAAFEALFDTSAE